MQVSFSSCTSCASYAAQGYGDFDGNIFKKIGSAVKKTVKTVKKAAAAIDPSSSKSVFGKDVAAVMKPVATWVVKPAIATAVAAQTMGLSVLAAEKLGTSQQKSVFGVRPTVTGLAEGALIGGAILAAPAVAGGGITAGGAVSAVGTGAAAVGTAVGVAKQTGLLPGAKPPAVPGEPQPALLDPGVAPAAPLTASMGKTALIGSLLLGVLALGYYAMPPSRKGRR